MSELPILQAVDVIVAFAKSQGFEAIPQFFALTARLQDDGSEKPEPLGPLRYTFAEAAKDALAAPCPATFAFIVRIGHPDVAHEAAAIAEHLALATRERSGGGS